MLLFGLPYLIDKIFPSRTGDFDKKGFIEIKGLPQEIYDLIDDDFSTGKREFSLSKKANYTRKLSNSKKIENLIRRDDFFSKPIQEHLVIPSLDIGYLFFTNYEFGKSRRSMNWHHDSVGRRLKLFLPLETTHNPTLAIEEDSRLGGFSNPMMSDSDRSEYKPQNRVNHISFQKGRAVVVDTSFIHAGLVPPEGGVRYVAVFEFSNIFKSLCRGRVGKRKTP